MDIKSNFLSKTALLMSCAPLQNPYPEPATGSGYPEPAGAPPRSPNPKTLYLPCSTDTSTGKGTTSSRRAGSSSSSSGEAVPRCLLMREVPCRSSGGVHVRHLPTGLPWYASPILRSRGISIVWHDKVSSVGRAPVVRL